MISQKSVNRKQKLRDCKSTITILETCTVHIICVVYHEHHRGYTYQTFHAFQGVHKHGIYYYGNATVLVTTKPMQRQLFASYILYTAYHAFHRVHSHTAYYYDNIYLMLTCTTLQKHLPNAYIQRVCTGTTD